VAPRNAGSSQEARKGERQGHHARERKRRPGSRGLEKGLGLPSLRAGLLQPADHVPHDRIVHDPRMHRADTDAGTAEDALPAIRASRVGVVDGALGAHRSAQAALGRARPRSRGDPEELHSLAIEATWHRERSDLPRGSSAAPAWPGCARRTPSLGCILIVGSAWGEASPCWRTSARQRRHWPPPARSPRLSRYR
jgi:hypothetical protein